MNMSSIEIERVLTRLFSKSRTSFLGVFSRDRIPSPAYIKAHTPCCYVANSDQVGSPGKHWIAFYHSDPNSLDFFDSYGNDPKYFGFLLTDSFRIHHNTRKIQSDLSIICGAYCIFFLLHRNRGQSLETICRNLFYMNRNQVDSYVLTSVRKLVAFLHLK